MSKFTDFYRPFAFIFIGTILFASALFSQAEWTKYESNPVMVGGPEGSWDEGGISGVDVLFDGETYKMWYCGQDSSAWGRIGYATSTDGITWTKHENNPVLDLEEISDWNCDAVSSPVVIFDGTMYKMWYAGQNSSGSQIGYATSPDGINWTKYNNNPVLKAGGGWFWTGSYISPDAVIFNGSIYKMWYSRRSGLSEGGNGIGLAESADGFSWDENGDNPSLNVGQEGAWDESVWKSSVIFIKNKNRHQMWYASGSNIGHATTFQFGFRWIKNPLIPVLSIDNEGGWDSSFIGGPKVIVLDDGRLQMWYVGSSEGSLNSKVGYATFLQDSVITALVPQGAQVEHLAGDFDFAEGPLWHPDGFLLCSDIDGDRIFKIDPYFGMKEVYLSPSGGANGLAFDRQKNLIMCRAGERDLARLESDGSITVLASLYNGKRFNSPNDLVVRSDGTIFFTDPYTSRSPSPRELDFDGIYCLTPGGELKLLETSVSAPNGICLSPDENKLYVNETLNLGIYIFDIESDLSLTNKRIFAQIGMLYYLDGMKVDENGLLFTMAGFNEGVYIFSPDGHFIDLIDVPGPSTNLNWGGTDNQTLFITTRNDVYKIRLNTKGFVPDTTSSTVKHKHLQLPYNFKLLPNYPNPFNPTTTISYALPASAHIRLTIYDQLGRHVKTLVDAQQAAGHFQTTWNGLDEKGVPVAAGMYFCQMKTQNFKKVIKLALVK
jgi:gluconolactonase